MSRDAIEIWAVDIPGLLEKLDAAAQKIICEDYGVKIY